FHHLYLIFFCGMTFRKTVARRFRRRSYSKITPARPVPYFHGLLDWKEEDLFFTPIKYLRRIEVEREEKPEFVLPQSSIIRFWVDESSEENAPARWRGQITHVSSGKMVYLQSFGEISNFILPFLEALGVKVEGRDGD
ncbi:MAG TPA: hypothetical protein VKD91_10810, partial [Pyrinomonadaceae bacterium]|nr:hypothetical protein [Pyrinomonadaceae bacterium]